MIRNFSIESVLLGSIDRIQFLYFLSIYLPKSSNLFQQVCDLSILKCNLGIEYF